MTHHIFVDTCDLDLIRLDPEFYEPEVVQVVHKIRSNPYGSDYLRNLARDIKDGPGGWSIHTDDYTKSGIPIIRGGNIVNATVELDNCVFISEHKHKELNKHKVIRGDVVLSVRGTIGHAAVFNLCNYEEASIGGAIVRMRPKECIHPYFLVAFFNCCFGRKQTERISNGVVQNNMNLTETGSNLVPTPPLKIQAAIGNKILKASRLKIIAFEHLKNARLLMHQHLDAFRKKDKNQPVFYSYDKNFDPFEDIKFDEPVDEHRHQFHASFIPANIVGDSLSPQSYRPDIVAAINEMELYFNCRPLSEFCSQKVRQGTTPDYGDDGPPCLKPRNVQHLFVEAATDASVTAKCAYENKDSVLNREAVLINRSGAFTIGRAGVYLEKHAVFISEHLFVCIPNDNCDAAFLVCFLNTWWGKRAIEAGISGSTGQLQLPQRHVANLPIPKVDLELQKQIGNKIRETYRIRNEVEYLISSAIQDVEALISGTLDETKLLQEGQEIAAWLKANPLPDENSKEVV